MKDICLKNNITPGNVGFYKKSVTSVEDLKEEVQFRSKAVYPENLLVWITISEKGISVNYLLSIKKLH